MTEEDLVANLERRASEGRNRIGKRLVAAALAQHPWVVPDLLAKLESMGVLLMDPEGRAKSVRPPTDGEIEQVKMSFQAKAVAKRKAVRETTAASPTDQMSVGNGESCCGGADIPTKYWTIDALTPSSAAAHILCKLEPASMSLANLRAIAVRGRSHENHMHHIRLIEFATGLPPDFGLTGSYRRWTKLFELCEHRSMVRGRRCRDIALPVDYNRNGLYSLRCEEGGITVRHNFSHQEVFFRIAELPIHHDFSDIYVSSNWSETRAALTSSTDTLKKSDIILLTRFPEQEVNKNIPKDGLLALEDGASNGADQDPSMETPPKTKALGSRSGQVKRRGPKGFVSSLAKVARMKLK